MTQAQETGRQGGKAHDGQKTKATILAKYGDDYYKKIAAKKRKRTTQVNSLGICAICGVVRWKHSGYSYDQYGARSKETHEFLPI